MTGSRHDRHSLCNDYAMRTMTISADDDAPLFHAGNRVFVRSPGRVVAKDDPSEGFLTTLLIEYDNRLGRFVAAAVMVNRRREAVPLEVTGAALRDLRVLELLQAGADYLTFSDWGVVDKGQEMPRATKEFREIHAHSGRATSETIELAAFIYRAATVLNLPPLKEVADILEVSQSTATRFITRARAENRLKVFDGEQQ
jgi:hypothetical protein